MSNTSKQLIVNNSISVRGSSVAAKGTSLLVEPGILLDCGVQTDAILGNVVCITHAHLDHISNIWQIILKSYKAGQMITIFAPTDMCENLRIYIDSSYNLTRFGEKKTAQHMYTLVEVQAGEIYDITIKNKEYQIEIIKCYHNVPTVGYGFSEKRRKLLPQNQQLIKDKTIELIRSGVNPTIAAKKASEYYQPIFNEMNKKYLHALGEYIELKNEINSLACLDELSRERELAYLENQFELIKSTYCVDCENIVPTFCFLGDTDERIFSNESYLLKKYKTIIIECTFLKDDDLENAHRKKHMHWKYLEQYINMNNDKEFLLIHFSAKYSSSYIKSFFKHIMLPNVIPFGYTSCYNNITKSAYNKKKNVNQKYCNSYSVQVQ